jgi:hypothetical protein
MIKNIRIGGASGYWGDSHEAPKQLIEKGDVDYLAFDFLAEVTMSILARARARSDQAGYAADFVTMLTPLLPEIAKRGIKVVANAGGVNLEACRQALTKACEEQGVSLSIGVVDGDNLTDRADEMRALGVREIDTGTALPDRVMSLNAYLGAFPIAAALDAGANIVITGRCVDSAIVLGPLIHEFGWRVDDYDKLAQGSLAGHLLECGAQATGGNFTDWRDVAGDWHDMGYPIAVAAPDGSFDITKPHDTGGLVSPLTVGEQMLYEIGDTASYLLPDVACDFRQVTIRQSGKNVVSVAGARGRAPGPLYKVSGVWQDGYKCSATAVIAGLDVIAKAEALRGALLKRLTALFAERGYDDFGQIDGQIVGAESLYGDNAQPSAKNIREVVFRLAVRHRQKEALELFAKEFIGTALSMVTGRCGIESGLPKVSPMVRLYSFMLPKDQVAVDGAIIKQSTAPGCSAELEAPAPDDSPSPAAAPGAQVSVPLIKLAVARSGDKGNSANIGVIARDPAYLPAIRQSLTAAAMKDYFAHFADGAVERFEVPGIHGLNFLLHDALGGGGMASGRLDVQAKTYAQLILDYPILISAELAAKIPA